jgi:predicted Abi (CAAX) family protease
MIEQEQELRPGEVPESVGAGKGGPQTSYFRFLRADYNHPAFYPLSQRPDASRYLPAATWLGRLILPPPEQRAAVMGALFEVHLAGEGYEHLVGQTVWLRWTDDPLANARFWGVTKGVIFDKAAHTDAAKGVVLPQRVNNLPLVNPFESLAASLPADEVIVRLHEPVQVVAGAPGGTPGGTPGGADGGAPPTVLYTPREPVQTTGRYYGLVQFQGPDPSQESGGDRFRVAHFNRESGAFDGPQEVLRLPPLVPDANGHRRASSLHIERSPANGEGWYVYGAPDREGTFVVQSLAPRGLLRLRPGQIVVGREAGKDYLKPKTWKAHSEKGTFTSDLLLPDGSDPQAGLEAWREGDAALVVHLWGLIGGRKPEPSAKTPLAWGHTSLGVAQVVREPLSGDLIFDIEYQQIYIHNTDGIIAGAQHWTRYSGDRQFGWLGTRPIQDVLIKLDCFTEDFQIGTLRRSALTQLAYQLEQMAARYRIADGRGATHLTAANNCSQDSSQALYAAIKVIEEAVTGRADILEWRRQDAEGGARMERLLALGRDMRKALLPFGSARADWEHGTATLGVSLTTHPLRSLGLAVRSWRTLLPSVAARSIAGIFIDHGASAWVLRTNQVGGEDPDIAPFVPNV